MRYRQPAFWRVLQQRSVCFIRRRQRSPAHPFFSAQFYSQALHTANLELLSRSFDKCLEYADSTFPLQSPAWNKEAPPLRAWENRFELYERALCRGAERNGRGRKT